MRHMLKYVPCVLKFQQRRMGTTHGRRELTLPVPWGHVSAVSWGDSRGEPVLLVHGILDNADSFKRLVRHLPTNYHYVSIDLPGHGLSSHFPPGMVLDLLNFILTIHYTLNELNWNNCLYIGHSLGAVLGTMYAILYPPRLNRILAIDALLGMPYKPEEVTERLKIIQDAVLTSLQQKEPKLYTKNQSLDRIQNKRAFPMTEEAAEALFNRAVTKIGDKYKFNRDERMRKLIGLYLDDDHNLEFLKNLKTPVLFLFPKESWFHLCRKSHLGVLWREEFQEYITTVDIDGNHDVHNNNPEIVAPFVVKFFDYSKK